MRESRGLSLGSPVCQASKRVTTLLVETKCQSVTYISSFILLLLGSCLLSFAERERKRWSHASAVGVVLSVREKGKRRMWQEGDKEKIKKNDLDRDTS